MCLVLRPLRTLSGPAMPTCTLPPASVDPSPPSAPPFIRSLLQDSQLLVQATIYSLNATQVSEYLRAAQQLGTLKLMLGTLGAASVDSTKWSGYSASVSWGVRSWWWCGMDAIKGCSSPHLFIRSSPCLQGALLPAASSSTTAPTPSPSPSPAASPSPAVSVSPSPAPTPADTASAGTTSTKSSSHKGAIIGEGAGC